MSDKWKADRLGFTRYSKTETDFCSRFIFCCCSWWWLIWYCWSSSPVSRIISVRMHRPHRRKPLWKRFPLKTQQCEHKKTRHMALTVWNYASTQAAYRDVLCCQRALDQARIWNAMLAEVQGYHPRLVFPWSSLLKRPTGARDPTEKKKKLKWYLTFQL